MNKSGNTNVSISIVVVDDDEVSASFISDDEFIFVCNAMFEDDKIRLLFSWIEGLCRKPIVDPTKLCAPLAVRKHDDQRDFHPSYTLS